MRWAHMVFWLVVVLAFAMGGRAIAQEAAVSEQESVARDRAHDDVREAAGRRQRAVSGSAERHVVPSRSTRW